MHYHNYHSWYQACQAYVLKFFDFDHSQNQSHFLFLSPKLLKLSKLSKFSLLLLLYSEGSQALIAHTSKVIEGTAPYLTFDEGLTKATSTDSLLYIKLPDGKVITPSTNISHEMYPISLPYAGNTLGDIDMLIPSSVSSVSLNDLVKKYNYWRDDDGDGQSTNGVTATGSISVSFTDRDGNTVSRSDTLDACKAPYKVTLSGTGGSLTTQYGLPNSSTFSGNTVTYYINPNIQQARVCHVRPNLLLGGTTRIVGFDFPFFAGPSSIWNSEMGFLTQSTNPSSYGLNFPTTGADGLYFDFIIAGITSTWGFKGSSVSHGGITATVSPINIRSDSHKDPYWGTIEHDKWIVYSDSDAFRVTLRGPRADSSQINSSSPSPLTVPSLPQTFELVVRDSSGNAVVKYGFVLRQWFVNRGNKQDTQPNQSSWCRNLGYRLSQVKDLVNAKCGVNNDYFPCINGIDGATPSSGTVYYQRRIGAGFFSEWGSTPYYADADFFFNFYWTRDASGDSGLVVFAGKGGVSHGDVAHPGGYAVCTTP